MNKKQRRKTPQRKPIAKRKANVSPRSSELLAEASSAAAKRVDESPLQVDTKGDDCVLTLRTKTIRTLADALAEGHVDTEMWEVERWTLNKWDVVSKLPGNANSGDWHLESTELWQVKVWFKRKSPELRGLQLLLEDIRACRPMTPKITHRRPALDKERRALELDIMDPHFGMHCYTPASDQNWSLDQCEAFIWWAMEDLLALAAKFAPYVEIVIPFGNDYLHADNVWHTTTAGTGQPEMMAWHETFHRGGKIGIAMIEKALDVAPVRVIHVPGNHDRQSSFALAHVLAARFHGHKHVKVDCSAAPYKAWEFGCNLIGFEHGHSVNRVRLAALMANEWRDAWARTEFHEWHNGDQHRKGTSSLLAFEEQGVSVEFLQALTPPNEWHKLKSFNFQKRGAVGWIWSDRYGPVDKLQCHISKYTGLPLGRQLPKTTLTTVT